MLRRNTFKLLAIIILSLPLNSLATSLLIPMDETQADHLKAYGVVYKSLEWRHRTEWLLNCRGGSFLVDSSRKSAEFCQTLGVTYEVIADEQVSEIYEEIEVNNMERVELVKAPRICVYRPVHAEVTSDAVTLALNYAHIPYKSIWDEEVLTSTSLDPDVLCLHHEDFTGQYGKFYGSFRNEFWYQAGVLVNSAMASRLGFAKVSELKLAVAREIRRYVDHGGILFAMCSAGETIDIALAAEGVDIVPEEFDGDPVDAAAMSKLAFFNTFAFEHFDLEFEAKRYKRSNIDTYPDRMERFPEQKNDYFHLVHSTEEPDVISSILTQNHIDSIAGFMGQVTGFRKSLLKDHVVVLAEPADYGEARYIHGNLGSGTFTFLSGHDPEDYMHIISDPPTDLSMHRNSPGYRLILNNILLGAVKKDGQ